MNFIETVRLEECPVPCLQYELELAVFLGTAIDFQPKKIIEIGTFFGGTLWFFLKFLRPEKVTCVDLLIPSHDERYQLMMDSRKKWGDWATATDTKLYDIQGNSRSEYVIDLVRSANPYNDIDILHIDGDHTYEAVKADYENYKGFVRPGGMIVFHDIVWSQEVRLFWEELRLDRASEIDVSEIIFEGGFGIGVIITPENIEN